MGTQGTHLQTEWILKSWLTPCPSANGYTRYTSAERMASFLCCHSISIMWLTQRAEAMVPCRCYPTKLPPFQREPSRTADLQIFAKQTTYGDPGRGMGWEVRDLSRGFPWILQGSSNDIKTRRSTTTAPPTVVGMCAGKSQCYFRGPLSRCGTQLVFPRPLLPTQLVFGRSKRRVVSWAYIWTGRA